MSRSIARTFAILSAEVQKYAKRDSVSRWQYGLMIKRLAERCARSSSTLTLRISLTTSAMGSQIQPNSHLAYRSIPWTSRDLKSGKRICSVDCRKHLLARRSQFTLFSNRLSGGADCTHLAASRFDVDRLPQALGLRWFPKSIAPSRSRMVRDGEFDQFRTGNRMKVDRAAPCESRYVSKIWV